ncbi:MAG TPA: Uma2 family endonuclease [Candidatus Elarobacter sp.]
MREIVLPEQKPALEWVRGRVLQKVSPKRRHSRLQAWWVAHLGEWAKTRGEAGPEWRFRLAPPNQRIRPLVPDVAFLSYDRMGDASEDELEAPRMAPNVAVEILSPDDRHADVAHKIGVYLASGTDAVIVVDPFARTVAVHARDRTRTFGESDRFEAAALPEFTFHVAEMFDVLRVRRP